jgi:outer membrane protein assembly factor BamB
LALVVTSLARPAAGGDQAQWGEAFSRNQVSTEKNLPDSFDPSTRKNIKWIAPLGSETYVCPIVAAGKVLIGTNNKNPRDPRHQGDRGIMLCLDARDGHLVWQLVVPKVGGDPYLDWPNGGICSPATVEGDRVYLVTNRAEVVCLDLNGQANGNDGPFRDEGKFSAPAGHDPIPVGPTDADILWVCELPKEAGIYRHDASDASILIHGRHLYLNTSNGVDNTHRKIRLPDAPGLVVLDKATGRVIARDEEHMAPRTFHCTWSSPSMGEVGGRKVVFFGGPDGVCYAFEALRQDAAPAGDQPLKLKKLWSFECDPNSPKENVHKWVGNRNESPSNILGMPVFLDGRVFVAAGGDQWWGKRKSWLKCIDATKTGDVTKSAELWSAPLKSHCCSTPSIHDGLVYITDLGRTIHCLDVKTGQEYWTHQAKGEFWSSTLVADGKVYVGSRGNDFYIFAAGKEKKLLFSVNLDSPISAPPTASDGVLYLATMEKLYAIQQTPAAGVKATE